MLRILNEVDGFDIKERELMRVRAKNRWLLRVPNGMKQKKVEGNLHIGGDVMDQLQQALFEDGSGTPGDGMDGDFDGEIRQPARASSPELSPEVLAKRMERLQKLQAESEIRWASRKRRRRTRGWAGLPADPPGPPRFPSETTIDESKAFLSLDSNMYRDIRAKFQRICEEADVIKKTIAGPERWEAVKARLVQESPHLQQVFWQETNNQEQKKLALDVVCTDVTKRMRTLERRMTIAEAKNALGINPEESRQVRNEFYATLKADHFTSKLEAGDEHWKELKQSWIDGNQLLTNILAPGDADPMHAEKVKAMEVLCRDVMKRLRDDQTKRDPTRKKKFDTNASATTAKQQTPTKMESQLSQDQKQNQHQSQPPQSLTEQLQNEAMNPYVSHQQQSQHDQHQQHQQQPQREDLHYSPMQQPMTAIQPHDALVAAAAQAQAQAEAQQRHMQAQAQVLQRHNHNQSHILMSDHDDMRIDPSLLLATGSHAVDPSLEGLGVHHNYNLNSNLNPSMNNGLSQEQQYADQQYTAAAASAYHSSSSLPPPNHQSQQGGMHGVMFPMAVYFRMHPASDFQPTQRLWAATLNGGSVEELRDLAAQKYPGTVLVRLEGIMKDGGVGGNGVGSECSLQIECDEELEAYLQAIGGVKPVFCTQLMHQWKEGSL